MSTTISSDELFIQKSLQFDIEEHVSLPFTDAKFGILTLNAISSHLSNEEHHFIFMIDCSGSMEDPCSDGRTKMQHTIHTLKNMIHYFKENNSIKVNITIDAFDDKIHTILETSPVNNDNYESIIEKINKIHPKSSTDIGLALSSVKNTVEKIKSEFPTHNIINIFMTDGEATKGNKDYKYLSELVDITVTNTFIGFGIDHDAALLNAVSRGENSKYHFIDKLENAGLVYGEILHEIIYKLLKNVQLSVHNGLIYNFKNNTWVDTIYIGEIVSEANKIYHIASKNPDDCSVVLTGEKLVLSEDSYSFSISKKEENTDLTKYVYRQRTLQHLFIVNEFLERKNTHKMKTYDELSCESPTSSFGEEERYIKAQLRDFIEEMKKYMEENNLETDKLMKNLCDDIYICYRTFGTKFETMYACARQTSQGTQRCYNVSHTPDIIDEVLPTNPYGLSRQTSQSTQRYYAETLPGPPILTRQTNHPINSNWYNDDIQHTLSNFSDTPYLTLGATRLMRDISCGTKSCDIFSQETKIDNNL